MSAEADRGQAADVSEAAKLSMDDARKWAERREKTLVENAQRNERRYVCLRDSAIAGACSGLMGGMAVYRYIQSRSPNAAKHIRDMNLRNMGSGSQAFAVIWGFFMPFMFVSNVVRWRCQKQGLKRFQPADLQEGKVS